MESSRHFNVEIYLIPVIQFWAFVVVGLYCYAHLLLSNPISISHTIVAVITIVSAILISNKYLLYIFHTSSSISYFGVMECFLRNGKNWNSLKILRTKILLDFKHRF